MLKEQLGSGDETDLLRIALGRRWPGWDSALTTHRERRNASHSGIPEHELEAVDDLVWVCLSGI